MRIIVESKNTRDVKLSELADFAEALRTAYPDAEVETVGKEWSSGALGVTLYEVFTVWLPVGITYAQVLAAFVHWARERFKKSPGRPKSLTIYDATGKPLKSVTLHSPESAPIEDERRPDPRLPPSH